MSTTLAQLIQLVRSRHPAFRKEVLPDKALADFFTTEQRRVLTLALYRDKTYAAVSLSITNFANDFVTGITIDPYHSVLGGTVTGTGSDPWKRQLKLVPYHERLNPREWPAASLLNQTLFLCGPVQRWDEVSEISLQYVPIPPALTALTDTLSLPDTAVQLLVARGALISASRVSGLPDAAKVDSAPLIVEAQLAEKDFLDTITLTSRTRILRMRPRGY